MWSMDWPNSNVTCQGLFNSSHFSKKSQQAQMTFNEDRILTQSESHLISFTTPALASIFSEKWLL